jgi:hypothetical protein
MVPAKKPAPLQKERREQVLALWAEKQAALKSKDHARAKALRIRLRRLHYKEFIAVEKPKTNGHAVKKTGATQATVKPGVA